MPDRILVVDDDEALRESLAMLLAAEGYEVVTAGDANGALARLEEPVDVVLCDVRMPGRDGLELLPDLIRRLPGAPVLMMSAYGSGDLAVEVGDNRYLGNTVIISTGASARALGIPSERSLLGHSVSMCATCDGFFFKGQKVFVVGGGDTAMEEATFLTRFASKVVVVHRRDSLRASKIMQERAFKNPKISFIWDTVVEDVLDPAAGKVTQVRLKNLKTGAAWEAQVDGLFVAIGHLPNTALFKGQLDLHPNEYIKVKPGTTQTSVPGVFAAGDVQDFTYRQAVTAAGTGCMAALEAERYLEAEGLGGH